MSDSTLAPTQVDRFLTFQEQDLALRSKELDNNTQLSQKSIDAEVELDTTRQKTFLTSNFRKNLILGLAIICATGFSCYALYLDQQDLLQSLMKLAIGAFGGGGFGYVYGFRKGRSD
jgi:hypothetical protein